MAIRLKEIDGRLARLREIRAGGWEAFSGDGSTQAAAERHFQIAIQSAIDIATHLLAEESAEAPPDYASALRMLAERGILERELAQRLALAAGLRNILVHLYLEVDPARFWESLSNLEDFEEFGRQVGSHLS